MSLQKPNISSVTQNMDSCDEQDILEYQTCCVSAPILLTLGGNGLIRITGVNKKSIGRTLISLIGLLQRIGVFT